jgi:hypothetical protein
VSYPNETGLSGTVHGIALALLFSYLRDWGEFPPHHQRAQSPVSWRQGKSLHQSGVFACNAVCLCVHRNRVMTGVMDDGDGQQSVAVWCKPLCGQCCLVNWWDPPQGKWSRPCCCPCSPMIHHSTESAGWASEKARAGTHLESKINSAWMYHL